MKKIPFENYRRSFWKNGLGHTDEIAIHPAHAELKAGNFDWRISSAKIDQDSPFSLFPDHDRILVILRGNGIRLTHTFVQGEPEEEVSLSAFEPYEFPGDVPSRCQLVDGGVIDLSIFLRKGAIEAQATVLELTEPTAIQIDGRLGYLFAAEGGFEATLGSERLEVRERDTLYFDFNQGPGPTLNPSRGRSKVILISLV